MAYNKSNNNGNRNGNRGNRNNHNGNRKLQKVVHPHFAVRRLPLPIFRHYQEHKQADSIDSSRFYHSDGEILIEVTRDDEYDTWTWRGGEFHVAADILPKQIFRYYRQGKREIFIRETMFYLEDKQVVVQVDLGDTIDIWRWQLANDNNNTDDFRVWKIESSEPTDGEAVEVATASEWEFTESGMIEEDDE